MSSNSDEQKETPPRRPAQKVEATRTIQIRIRMLRRRRPLRHLHHRRLPRPVAQILKTTTTTQLAARDDRYGRSHRVPVR